MAKNRKKDTVDKYRLTIFNDEDLKEISTFRLTKLNIFAISAIIIMLIVSLTIVVIFYTPVNMLLSSHSVVEAKKQVIDNSILLDSLKQDINTDKKYIAQIKNILQGNIPVDTFSENQVFKDKKFGNTDLNFNKSDMDSIMKAQIEEVENENLSIIKNTNSSTNLKNLHFVVPLKGMITNEFNIKNNHLGIDIVGGKGDVVLATLPGTVIIATWSLETGYLVQIQHDNNLISVYKHNSVLLKKSGDRVVAGESVAIVGNSGENTTGPHLHFELWYNGNPVNPRDYITFTNTK